MPIGYHPDLANGALIGALVVRQIVPDVLPIGEPTIETQGLDENGESVTLQSPNPDYVPGVPAQDVTVATILAAVRDAGIDVRDVFESGDAPQEQARIAFQIPVSDPDEAARRAAIDNIVAQFAP